MFNVAPEFRDESNSIRWELVSHIGNIVFAQYCTLHELNKESLRVIVRWYLKIKVFIQYS